MNTIIRLAVLIFGVALLAGCSSDADNAMPPSPLKAYTPSVQAVTVWDTSVGNGNGGYYFRMRPAARNGVLFVASRNGEVSAVDSKTGRTLWDENIGANITSGVGVGGGNVYVGTDNANVVALSAQDGHLIWHAPVASEVWAAPEYARGIVLAHTITGNLSAFSASTGHLIWRYDEAVPSMTLHAASQPEVAGNTVVAGFADGHLVVLNLQTGNMLWQQQVALPRGNNVIDRMVDITVDPVVVNGVAYVATYQGRVAAYDLDKGQLIWSHKISSYSGITADRHQVYVTDAEGRVWCFDEATGAVAWRQTDLKGRQLTGPAVIGQSVAVADRYGFVHFLSRSSGKLQDRTPVDADVIAQPVAYNGQLFVLGANGHVWSYVVRPLKA